MYKYRENDKWPSPLTLDIQAKFSSLHQDYIEQGFSFYKLHAHRQKIAILERTSFSSKRCIFLIGWAFIRNVQGDQLNMTVFFFWYLGNSDLPRVIVYSSVHWASQFLLGTRKTRPCLTGHPVLVVDPRYILSHTFFYINYTVYLLNFVPNNF